MIEFEDILRENCKIAENLHEYSDEDVIWCMKEAIKQAIPIILKEVSEKAKIKKYYFFSGNEENIEHYSTDFCSLDINKEQILSLEQELIQKLLKNE